MGKGSAPRPIPDRETFEANWDKIFNKAGQAETQPESESDVRESDSDN